MLIIPQASGTVAAAIGVTVLTGWATNIEIFTTLLPGMIVMLPNTAVGFLCGGAALALGQRTSSIGLRRVATVLASIVLLLGVLTFAERTSSLDFGIDRLLFADRVARFPYRPIGRMATNSTVCFVLAAIGLLVHGPRTRRVTRIAAGVGLLISVLALVGYLYGVKPLYVMDAAAGMALFTAIGFTTLLSGILFLDSSAGRIGLLTGRDLGALMTRRLIPWIVFVPLLIGRLWIWTRKADLISLEGAAAAYVLLTITLLAILVLRSAAEIRAIDVAYQETARREREARTHADEMRRLADAANQAKSAFLASMSHELRTPLNAITGYTALMAAGLRGPLSEAQMHDLDRVQVNASHLSTIIGDVLDHAKAETGRLTLAADAVPLVNVLKDIDAVVGPQAASKRLTLEIARPDESIVVRGDLQRLRQILVNLLANAVKFTEPGGRVIVVSDVDESSARIRVTDTGIGIDARDLDAIFSPFVQLEQGLVGSLNGVGLGLTISRELARGMGGDIHVVSKPGAGSTFTLTLPLLEQAAS